MASTGIVATLGKGKPVVALRTDIDALPVTEPEGLDFRSTVRCHCVSQVHVLVYMLTENCTGITVTDSISGTRPCCISQWMQRDAPRACRLARSHPPDVCGVFPCRGMHLV